MVYTIEQIKELVEPIAKKYNLKALWIFGSYARGEATEESDVDFVMDYTDSTIDNLESLSDIRLDLETKFNKKIDLVPINYSSDQIDIEHFQTFIRKVINERVQIYERN